MNKLFVLQSFLMIAYFLGRFFRHIIDVFHYTLVQDGFIIVHVDNLKKREDWETI